MQVLVFSHSVRMLDIMEHLVIMAGYMYLRLDGFTMQCIIVASLKAPVASYTDSTDAMQVLVFSHSVRMLDIIERLVIMAGYVYLRLDGSTKQQDRQAKVDAFNTSASVFLFLISTTAGGLGLNLTAANR